MAAILQQDVWSLTGATGLGKMVSDVNTAMVEGPLAGAAGVLGFITKLSETFSNILNGWTPQEGETGFSQADMAALLERMQNRWLGIIATRQKITVSVAVKTSRSQAERLSAELGLGYGAAGFTGTCAAMSGEQRVPSVPAKATSRNSARRARGHYHGRSDACDLCETRGGAEQGEHERCLQSPHTHPRSRAGQLVPTGHFMQANPRVRVHVKYSREARPAGGVAAGGLLGLQSEFREPENRGCVTSNG
jgi:hypothetical protein